MAGASIRIEVDDAEVAAGLKRLVETGADLRPVMEGIGDILLFSSQRRFETKTGPDGGAWAPFARSTMRRMPERRHPPQLLRDSGRLAASLTYLADDAGVQVGTNVIYAGIHQFGGAIAQPERQGSATFVIAKEGAGRTKDGKRVGSRLRFAKARSRAKSAHRRDFTVPARTIWIPARPYLGISDQDRADILALLAEHFERQGGTEAQP